MIKALFFDIDGTLVSFKTHSIPESTVNALAAAKANGVGIYISTGRPFPLINNLGQISHLIDGYITTNGAYCFIGDTVISCSPIPFKDVEVAIRKSEEMKFPCMVVGEKDLTMFNTKADPEKVRQIGETLNVNINEKVPLEDVLSQKILQLTPVISVEQEKEILPFLPHVEPGRWCPDFADFTAKGVNKAKGLRDIAAYRGIDLTETMAFGDGGNDLSIVEKAGIGVAMGNANTILKKSANHITTSVDDDGIYNALRHFNVIPPMC